MATLKAYNIATGAMLEACNAATTNVVNVLASKVSKSPLSPCLEAMTKEKSVSPRAYDERLTELRENSTPVSTTIAILFSMKIFQGT